MLTPPCFEYGKDLFNKVRNMKLILSLFFLLQIVQSKEPFKGCNLMSVDIEEMTFDQVIDKIYDLGFFLENKDEGRAFTTKPMEYRNVYVVLNVRIKDGKLLISTEGGLTSTELEKVSFIGMKGSLYKRAFEKAEMTAKSFGDVIYLKQ